MISNRGNYKSPPPYESNRGDSVERNGYQSRKAIIRGLTLAGKKLELARQEEYWDYFEQEEQFITPANKINYSDTRFMDKLDLVAEGEKATERMMKVDSENAKTADKIRADRRAALIAEKARLTLEVQNRIKAESASDPRL